jgi:hypothetical protein
MIIMGVLMRLVQVLYFRQVPNKSLTSQRRRGYETLVTP